MESSFVLWITIQHQKCSTIHLKEALVVRKTSSYRLLIHGNNPATVGLHYFLSYELSTFLQLIITTLPDQVLSKGSHKEELCRPKGERPFAGRQAGPGSIKSSTEIS